MSGTGLESLEDGQLMDRLTTSDTELCDGRDSHTPILQKTSQTMKESRERNRKEENRETNDHALERKRRTEEKNYDLNEGFVVREVDNH